MTIPRFLASALSAPTVWLGGYLLVSADVYRADRVREAVRHDVAAERAARPAVAVTADGEHVSVRAVLDATPPGNSASRLCRPRPAREGSPLPGLLPSVSSPGIAPD